MKKTVVNMERSYAFYAGGLGVVMVCSLILTNIPELALSQFIEIPYRRQISAALFLIGAAMGGLAVIRHSQRARRPWAVPQSQVSIPYLGFLGASVIALLLSR